MKSIMKRIGTFAILAALLAFGIGCSAPAEEGVTPPTPDNSATPGGGETPADDMAGGGTGTTEPGAPGEGGEAAPAPPTGREEARAGNGGGGATPNSAAPGTPQPNRQRPPAEIKPLSKDNPFDDGASIAAKKKNSNKN